MGKTFECMTERNQFLLGRVDGGCATIGCVGAECRVAVAVVQRR